MMTSRLRSTWMPRRPPVISRVLNDDVAGALDENRWCVAGARAVHDDAGVGAAQLDALANCEVLFIDAGGYEDEVARLGGVDGRLDGLIVFGDFDGLGEGRDRQGYSYGQRQGAAISEILRIDPPLVPHSTGHYMPKGRVKQGGSCQGRGELC
jgi:hypothetical protein